KKGASSGEQLSSRDTEWSRTLGEVVAARSSASASFVRWWTRTTQPPPVRRASSGCTRKTVGDNHGMGELSSQRLSVPSCDRTSVTGSGRLQGFFGTQTPLQWYLWSVTAPPSGVGGLLPAQGLVRVTYVDLVSWRP